jgi:hypothetical protein
MVTLSQSTATTVTALNSVACSANQAGAILYTRDNSFYRVFNLNQLGVTGAFRALRVDFGWRRPTRSTAASRCRSACTP